MPHFPPPQLVDNLSQVESYYERLNAKRQLDWEDALRKVKVIGCTTTGAAMFKDVLDKVQPNVRPSPAAARLRHRAEEVEDGRLPLNNAAASSKRQ